MAAATDARAAPSRSRVVARGLVRAAQVVGVLVLLRAMAELPWVAAAAPSVLRVAACFLAPQRICFILANGIVIALATLLFPRDAAASTFADASAGSPSSHSNGDAAPRQNPLLEFLVDPRAPEEQALTPSTEKVEPSREEVFEDKHAVHVKTKVRRAQPPRRTVSEKTGGGAAKSTTSAAAAAPEMRRAKSENGKRRSAAATAPAELGKDDAEAFRQAVEAFIAKQQTLFHREESLVIARSAAAAASGGEDSPAIAGAAAVAVK